jgi:hypothetical protein
VLFVKTKQQAAAIADAIMAPAEAKRQQDLAKRRSAQLRWVPEIADIPEPERDAVLRAAHLYAAKQWYLYLPALVAVAWFLFPIIGPRIGLPSIVAAPPPLFLAAIALTLFLVRLIRRRYVARVALNYGAVDRETTPGA